MPQAGSRENTGPTGCCWALSNSTRLDQGTDYHLPPGLQTALLVAALPKTLATAALGSRTRRGGGKRLPAVVLPS